MPAPDLTDRSIAELLDLTGKRALVTGAGRGIGLQCARRLVEAGATVAFADIDSALAKSALADVAKGEGDSIAFELDVNDVNAVSTGVPEIARQLGGLDIVVNNAAVFPAGPITEQTNAVWDQVIGTNLSGPYHCAKASAPYLFESGNGVIVNILSTEALKPASPGLSAYVSAKSGLLGLTKALAIEWGPAGVRAIGIAPTVVQTPGVENMKAQFAGMGEVIDGIAASLPMGRMGQPDDIARVMLFAVSGLAGMVTGSVLLADGGAMLL
jgi:NAD(P)-dependent dehydrogenase (short-subunit alcohol dehydrogenase family)